MNTLYQDTLPKDPNQR